MVIYSRLACRGVEGRSRWVIVGEGEVFDSGDSADVGSKLSTRASDDSAETAKTDGLAAEKSSSSGLLIVSMPSDGRISASGSGAGASSVSSSSSVARVSPSCGSAFGREIRGGEGILTGEAKPMG